MILFVCDVNMAIAVTGQESCLVYFVRGMNIVTNRMPMRYVV